MNNGFELILKPGATLKEHLATAFAITKWCTWAAEHPLIKEQRVIVKGGPYLTRDETLKLLRQLIPPEFVQDVLVDGRSWNDPNASDVHDAECAEVDMRNVTPDGGVPGYAI